MKVMPHIMFVLGMFLETDRLIIEGGSLQTYEPSKLLPQSNAIGNGDITANETSIFQSELFMLFLGS